MKSPRDLAGDTDPLLQQLRGMVRRFAITLTSKALWQLAGFRQADGSTETRQVEVFSGIGFYARPPSSGSPEAIAVMVGDASVPMIVATRDEKTRAAVAGNVQPGETAMFTPLAIVYMKSDGTIEVRSVSGTAKPLAVNAELAGLISVLDGWTPVPNDGGAALKTAFSAYKLAHPGWPLGTQKIKGE